MRKGALSSMNHVIALLIVLSSVHDLLTHVTSPKEFSVCGYVMHSPRVMNAQSHSTFWRHQATVIIEARR